MSEPTDRDDAPTIPFPAPRDPGPDHIGRAVAHFNPNRFPAELRESAAAIVRTWAAERGAVTVRLADVGGDDEEGGER